LSQFVAAATTLKTTSPLLRLPMGRWRRSVVVAMGLFTAGGINLATLAMPSHRPTQASRRLWTLEW